MVVRPAILGVLDALGVLAGVFSVATALILGRGVEISPIRSWNGDFGIVTRGDVLFVGSKTRKGICRGISEGARMYCSVAFSLPLPLGELKEVLLEGVTILEAGGSSSEDLYI